MSSHRRGPVRAGRRAAALSAIAGLALLAPGVQASPSTGIVAGILPVAVDDTGTVVHGRTRSVAAPGVLANDLQVGDGFTVRLVSGPSNGTLDLDPDGGYSYDADLDFIGEDQFRYRVDGGLLGLSNTATVRIAVTNQAPVARADAYTAVAGVERSVAAPGILGNDDDGDGDELTVDVVQMPSGALTAGQDGRFRYTADAGFTGLDTFTYRVTDGAAWSSTVQVRITVTAPAATASPTPTPTPTARPTPTPSPAPTTSLTPRPSPAPSDGGSPTPTPSPSDRPVPSPSPRGPGSDLVTPSPAVATARPSPGDAAVPPGDAAVPPGAGPIDPAASGRPPAGGTGLDVVIDPEGAPFDFDTVQLAFDGFEWAVPGLVLTVPGLLLILAVALQSLAAVGWLRVTRRWLGGDRSSRAAPGRR